MFSDNFLEYVCMQKCVFFIFNNIEYIKNNYNYIKLYLDIN